MENWLGLCLVLLSVTCSCEAVGNCSVPDTMKSSVTNLAINMGRNVGPCVPPDPCVLLALNLGQVKDHTAEDILIELLKKDAVDKVSNKKYFSSGKVALYVMALRSSCVDPSNISVPGGSADLVQVLETKTHRELQAFEKKQSSPSVLTTWYQVGLDVLGLCIMSKPYAISAAHILAKNISPSNCGSVDTAAVVTMGLVCVLGMENVPEKTLKSVNKTLSDLLVYIVSQQNDGLIGNAYSTGLAGQALLATQAYYSLDSWDCPRTIQKVIGLIPQKTYSLPIAAAQLLPFLWGESYVSVKSLPCPDNDVRSISVEFSIVNDLIGNHFKYSIIVEVREGSTLLQVMEKAAEVNSKEFSFTTQTSSWGVFITSINHLAGNSNDKTYWQFFSGISPLEKGVRQLLGNIDMNAINKCK
ncbi:PREDICTED: gastric intrinsic factor-like [Nanorana parkeri]|uniref:gastric intrinsic factor-like n=1 Tax=Nanorana parkeri TaxID=125878 RepID=UPI000854C0AD|nr:PREDICTED: gastric intrinsic factor-like [Nanorana parkeri]